MKEQPREYTVEVERDGVVHSRTYTIERGIITVSYEVMGRNKSSPKLAYLLDYWRRGWDSNPRARLP